MRYPDSICITRLECSDLLYEDVALPGEAVGEAVGRTSTTALANQLINRVINQIGHVSHLPGAPR
jgi:hypothetical protein